jgi:hypothetical protein
VIRSRYIEARLVNGWYTRWGLQKLSTAAKMMALLRPMIHSDGGWRKNARPPPKRGTRRLEWIELAVGGLQRRLKPAAYERLLTGWPYVSGSKLFWYFRDIRGLSGPQATEASEWLRAHRAACHAS